MSVDSCIAFLDRLEQEPRLRQSVKAVTDMREVVALGRRNGYSFEVTDIAPASAAVAASTEPSRAVGQVEARSGAETSVCHHELDLRDVPALQPLVEELRWLAIKPPTVDLDRYHESFRRDDLEWTSASPSAPGFRDRYEEVMETHWTGSEEHEFARRDFHLVNLDRHVDHPLYADYFDAKTRIVDRLEDVFGGEVRFSGSMWYPPFAYRLWHTNEDQPGWRMYLIDLDEDVARSDSRTFFRYMNPRSQELVTLPDRPKMVRFFQVEQQRDRLFWHCIVNGAARNRWSFGFAIPDGWHARLGL